MKLMNKLLGIAALVGTCVGASAVTGYITAEHYRIINSTIDSTPIGATVGSTGNFTGVTFNGLSGNTGVFNQGVTLGTSFSELQMSPGTTPPLRRGITWGLDPVGDFTFWLSEAQLGTFKWRESITGNQLMSLDDVGNLLTAGNMTAGGQVNSSGSMTAGGGLTSNGNATINGGETITGYLTAKSGATITGTITTNNIGINGNGSATGNFSAGSFSGPLTGSVNGNAATASSLQSAPSTCGANGIAYGITANGSALCTAGSGQIASGSTPNAGWVEFPGGIYEEWGQTSQFDTGPVTINFPHAFPNQCMNVQISDTTASPASRSWSAGGYTTTGFQAHNNGLGQGSWRAIGY